MKIFSEYRGLRKELYVLFIGRLMTNLGSMIWPMFTLILNQKLGLDASTIAVYMMIFTFGGMPVSLFGGKLADKFNKKNIIVICDTVSIAGYIYCALVPITVTSVIIFAVAALFQSAEEPSYDALVADFTTSMDRERAYSLSYLGSNLGLVLAPTLGGILLNDYLNLAFLINGLAIALSTVLILVLIKDVHREEDTSAQSIYEKELDHKASVIKYLFNTRVILMLIVAIAIEETVYNMYGYLMPLDLTAVYGENGSVIYGTVSSVNCMVVVACTALITRWFRKVKDSSKIIIGTGLILSGYFIFITGIRQVWLCYAAIVVFTFGEIFCTLSVSPFMTKRIPASHRGRILSVESVICGMIIALSRIGIGEIHDRIGATASWMLVIGIGLVAVACMFVMKKWDKEDYPALYH